MAYYIYILTSQRNGTLYIGVTNNLLGRVQQHREKKNNGFTKRYDVNMLMHYEEFQYIYDALAREKQLKNWRREWKLDLIEQHNPEWQDLYILFTGS